MSTILFDIETDGLLDTVSKLHCISTYEFEKNILKVWDNDTLSEGIELLKNATTLVGHNIIGYDLPALKKLIDFDWSDKIIRDTLVWARLVFPDIKNQIDWRMYAAKRIPSNMIGRHSLEAYGYRFKVYKGDYGKTTDWKHWTPEMSEYCKQDVVVTYKLYTKLLAEGFTKESIELEHQVANIIQRQKEHGFLFDEQKARDLMITLKKENNKILDKIGYVKPFVKKGKMFKPARDNKTRGYRKGISFMKIKIEDFKPSSTSHIAKWLVRDYNWKPTEFTEKTGEPQITEEILESIEHIDPKVKLIKEYLINQKVLGFIINGRNGWLKLVDDNQRMHGSVITNGAVTGRMTHKAPNVAQTPSVQIGKDGKPRRGVEGKWGYECRSLFKVPKGKKLVGCDASGLELRMLGHFMAWFDGGDYAHEVVNGDIHTRNQKAAGLEVRSQAKTFIYGFLYGAGAEKIGSIVGGAEAEGKRLKNKFLKQLPALKKLIESVKARAKANGYLIGLDGRRVPIRALHAALNVLLQGAGALVMKKALCILDETLQAKGYTAGKEYEFVANIHDEFQIEVDEDKAEEIGQLAVESIVRAGEYFKMKCPLDGEAKIGNNWAETH